MKSDSHHQILEDLISGKTKSFDIDQRIQALDLERFDTQALVTLQLKHIQDILKKFISQEWTAEEVEDWANLIESYDDIEYDEKNAEQIADLIYELATPENEGELNVEIAKEILDSIS